MYGSGVVVVDDGVVVVVVVVFVGLYIEILCV